MKPSQCPVKEDKNSISVFPRGVGQHMAATLAKAKHGAGPKCAAMTQAARALPTLPTAVVFGAPSTSSPSRREGRTRPSFHATPLSTYPPLYHRTRAVVNSLLPASLSPRQSHVSRGELCHLQSRSLNTFPEAPPRALFCDQAANTPGGLEAPCYRSQS